MVSPSEDLFSKQNNGDQKAMKIRQKFWSTGKSSSS
jgi:hypothetical protein